MSFLRAGCDFGVSGLRFIDYAQLCFWASPLLQYLKSQIRGQSGLGFSVFAVVALSTAGLAQTLTGTVINRTTNKPASGDEVVLLRLRQGMEEAGRGKTDATGKFSLKLDDEASPHLVRAIHQDVTYHRMAPPGTTSVEVEVFDVSKKVDPVSVTADVMRLGAESGTLRVVRRFSVSNSSSPPRTQMGDRNFEFYLPEGALLENGMAKSGGAQPINSDPIPQKERNRYAFAFPLRPGETQFQVSFHLPYTGEATIDPKPLYPAQHLVVMLPKTMQFTPGPGTDFQSMQDPNQSNSAVQIAANTQPGRPLSFRISGVGELPETMDNSGTGQSGGGAGQGRDSSPGGGLGPPSNAPDPLEKSRWYILGGLLVVLAAVAIYVTRRSKTISHGGVVSAEAEATSLPSIAKPVPEPIAIPHNSLLLHALKDEMFDLEVEHMQGRITQEEYDRTRTALGRTLERAIKRAAKS